ncbi:response regulator [Pseudomonas paraeruginosa]|uniref:Response regulator n=1 Tax=Pseudomonas paraeruginosa TaxID=2994495 RepID=A0A2R3IU00_9PSED|nr:response regulator [Pseudomonas paraeruginosa]AWE90238.1 response regulator [Pseudomonas paraeruginosa]
MSLGFQQHLHGHANHGMIVDYQNTAHCLISLPIKNSEKILLSKI